MKTMVGFAVAICGAVSLSAPALAQAASPDSTARAKELIVVMHADELIRKTMDVQLASMTKGLAGQMLGMGGVPDTIAKDPEFQGIVQRYLDRVVADTSVQIKLALPQVIDRMTGVYARNFTAAQLGDLIAFYRTPTGQAFIDKTPAVTAEVGEATRDLTVGPIMNVVKQDMPQFMTEMKAWADKHPQAAGTKQ